MITTDSQLNNPHNLLAQYEVQLFILVPILFMQMTFMVTALSLPLQVGNDSVLAKRADCHPPEQPESPIGKLYQSAYVPVGYLDVRTK
jgi:hypothetical protein